MKTMKNKTAISSMVQTACYAFAAVLLTASCANDDTTQNEKEQKTEVPAGTTAFNGFFNRTSNITNSKIENSSTVHCQIRLILTFFRIMQYP